MPSALLLIALLSPAKPPSIWVRYSNARFGYSVEHPTDMKAGPEPENGDGLVFTGNGLTLTVWGQNRIDSPDRRYKLDVLEWDKKGKITYHRYKPPFYVLSGHEGTTHFYQRTIWNNNVFASIILEYPAALDREQGGTSQDREMRIKFKSILGHITKSLKFAP